ncbi:MAG: serine--tRNA ligase [Armatimonadota bacterium]
MLDIRLIRENPNLVKQGLSALGEDPAMVDNLISIDVKRRELMTEIDVLRAERNTVSKEIPRIKVPEEKKAKIAAMREVGDKVSTLEAELVSIAQSFDEQMLRVPNLPHPSVPIGKDDTENVVTYQQQELPQFDFTPKPHWELAEKLGIIDFERGVKISGSRFYVLRGAGAALQRAVINFMLTLHTTQHGYTELYPPYMVKQEALVGTGNLPKFGDNLYHDAEEDLWWIPTAEVPVTNFHRDEILDASELPVKYVAYTACFRREKMSAGRDVRGIKRGHQFDKVEMVKLVTPETSVEELDKLVNDAIDVAKVLGLPYRLLQMCTGDLSFTAAMKYDVELWAAGCAEWLEVSSCSNFMDFQARRANIRYRPEAGAKPEYLHTLNGSGLALPRVMIAIMENYQQADGSILIPEPLRPFLGGYSRIVEGAKLE